MNSNQILQRIMKTKFLFGTAFTIILLISINACSSDNSSNTTNDCNGLVWSQAVQSEISAVSESGVAYSNDPTPAKCEAYKGALRNYVSALKDINVSCIPQASEQDYKEALAEAEQDIDDIDCSGS